VRIVPLEFVWTLVPGIILLVLGLLSLSTLYDTESIEDKAIRVKVTGRQWRWNYSYIDIENARFDRFIKPRDRLSLGDIRLYEVDNSLVLPMGIPIQFIVGRRDVIHSWTLIQAGIKADANPGAINLLVTKFDFPGSFYGRCRELCGINHSFIPIKVEVGNILAFKRFLLTII
jgi:heme/copper-type cytochrome/quinol oxidase subunit 2